MNRYTWRTGIREGVMVVVALIILFPIYIMVNLSVRPVTDLTSPLIPTQNPTIDNFGTAWQESGLGNAMITSIVVTAASVALVAILAALAAYGIVRLGRTASPIAFYGFMIGLFIPLHLGMIPLYRFFADNGMIGSVAPLILIYVGLRLPFTVFLYVGFMRQIPVEYEEAASLDGANAVQRFFRIIFPLSSAATGSAVILNALFTWNDFMLPLLYLGGRDSRTVPVAIYSFIGDSFTNWPVLFATLLIGTVPMLIVFLVVQKYLIRGFTSGMTG
jgi:raffinose/stachyose/melibiose transport system permease protein